MSPIWIAAGLTAAGVVALVFAAPRASAVELSSDRPWLLWEWSSERAMPKVRGTNTSQTGCELDLADVAMKSDAGKRFKCERMKGAGR